MRNVCLSFILLLSGCYPWGFSPPEAILSRPAVAWTSRDCLTLVLSAMAHNFHDPSRPPVAVCATPFTPRVMMALSRMSQLKEGWTDPLFQSHADALLLGAGGLYVDWERDSMFYGAGLKRVSGVPEMESLTLALTLSNRMWPCTPPVILTADNVGGDRTPDFMRPEQWPCDVPDISDLESTICLVTDRGDTVRPVSAWGRRNNQLTLDETVLMRFPLHTEGRAVLEGCDRVTLILLSLKPEVRLTMPVASLR